MSDANNSRSASFLTSGRNLFAALIVAAMAVAGCSGDTGPGGPAGPAGPTGPGGGNVANNNNGTKTITCTDGTSVIVQDAILDYAAMTTAELEVSNMAAVITSISIPDDGRPVVKLKVSERHGMGVKNLAPGGISWRFALLKLDTGVNGSANETWVSYMGANSTSTAGTETATAAALTDNADGTYSYRFTKVINAGIAAAGTTYEPTKPHRLVILMSASGNPFSPINLVKEFVPSTGADVTGQHEKFDPAACLECHTQFRAIAGGTGAFGSGEFHSGGRYDVRTCVACHNDQRRFTTLSSTTVGDAAISSLGTWTGNLAIVNNEAVINLPVFIHKIHMGEELSLKGGNYVAVAQPYEVTYPQDVRNCVKCHRNPAPNNPAPLADNWKNQPSRRACGACHDNISFVSPPPAGRVLHGGGPQPNDSTCLLGCHTDGALGGDPAIVHKPVSPPNPNNIYLNPTTGTANTNAAYVAAAGYVPPGAKVITYEVSTVTLDASRHPQITFRFLIADPTANPPVAAAPVTLPTFGTGPTELIPGFVGSPSAYFVYALPQDGITAPADFNASASGYIRNIWNGTATGAGAGTLTGPDASSYYTVTLTGVTIPANATMLTGGIGYSYSLGSAVPPGGAPAFSNNTQPFTQIDLATAKAFYPYTPNASGFAGKGGLIVPPPDKSLVATGFTARRAIVSNAKCDACHVALGVGPDFHAGQRNDSPTCAFCHRPNQSSSGWAANAKDFIHSIHAAEKRAVPFNWHAPSATEGYYKVTYPAVLNKCEMCHLAGTYDFSLSSTLGALPNMLMSTAGQGRYNSNAATNPNGYFSISPYVTSNNQVDYGFGFATSNVSATLPDGISGTQLIGGNTVACSPAAPCICSATNPCSVDLAGTYTVSNLAVSFTQKVGSATNACNETTPCTCTTTLPCTGVVATCSLTAPCQPQGTTLVTSPIAAACVACHDTAPAVDHMQTNGASVWEPRSIAISKPQKEECLICHGPNRLANISLVHTDRTP
jgi:OmcA/MtrC family decaheme c-type cytochrome